jgi:hypothetical protein
LSGGYEAARSPYGYSTPAHGRALIFV